MASFQQSVSLSQGAGQAGELYSNAPIRAKSFTIVSDPVVNYVGNACTVTSEGVCQMGGSGAFAGFLVDPKTLAAFGTAGDPLASNLIVPDQQVVTILQEGEIYVNLTSAGNIGDSIVYEVATGDLQAIDPTDTLPVGWLPAWAELIEYTLSSPGLAVVHVNKSSVINAAP